MARKRVSRDQKIFELTLAGSKLLIYKMSDGRYYYTLVNTSTQEQVQGKPYPVPEAASFAANVKLANLNW